jgi:mannose-6-phosphate isomerase
MNNIFTYSRGLTLEAYVKSHNPITLANIPEFFLSFLTLEEGESYSYDHKDFYSIYFPLSNNIGNIVSINQSYIKPGDSLNLVCTTLDIKASKKKCTLIISGFNKKTLERNETYSLTLLEHKNIYRVNKPWGHELWLNNNCGSEYFSFKEVYIKQGFQTSLQYHEKKMECALLYEGTCEVFFASFPNKKKEITNDGLTSKILNSYSKIFIKPNTIHRMKALSDIYHYEISTPELNDVIRLSDDSNRGNGRINSEHKQS